MHGDWNRIRFCRTVFHLEASAGFFVAGAAERREWISEMMELREFYSSRRENDVVYRLISYEICDVFRWKLENDADADRESISSVQRKVFPQHRTDPTRKKSRSKTKIPMKLVTCTEATR